MTVLGVVAASAGAFAAGEAGRPSVEHSAIITASESEADSAYDCFLKWLKGEPCDEDAEVAA